MRSWNDISVIPNGFLHLFANSDVTEGFWNFIMVVNFDEDVVFSPLLVAPFVLSIFSRDYNLV